MNQNKFQIPLPVWSNNREMEIVFPEKWQVDFCPMNGYHKNRVDDFEIKRALREPIATQRLAKIAQEKEEVAIVVDDMTRPTRVSQLLPFVLEELKIANISDDHIRFIMGGGLHGAWYRDDFVKKMGEEFVERYPVYNHSPFTNCEKIGFINDPCF